VKRLAPDLLLILALTTVLHLRALGAYFVGDDFNFAQFLGPGGSLSARELLRFLDPGPMGGSALWRPVAWLTWAIDYLCHGVRPAGFHVTSLLLQLACVAAVHRLAARLVPDGSPFAPGAAALLFALHPAHPDAVVWIAGRADVLATLFTLLALGAYARFRRTGERGSWVRALCAAVLALGSKENAVVLPAALALLHLRPAAARARRGLLALLPFFALLAGYLLLRRALFGEAAARYGGIDFTAALGGLRELWRPPVEIALGDRGGAPGIALLSAVLLGLVVAPGAVLEPRPALRRAALPALLFAATLLPLAGIPRTTAGRHFHLPLALFAVAGAATLPARRRPRLGLLALAPLAAVRLVQMNGALDEQIAAGRETRATQQAAVAARGRHPDARNVVMAGVPVRAGRVAVFHTGFQGAVSRPFTEEDLPVLPLFDDAVHDLDNVALFVEKPAAFLARGPGGAWREVGWLPGPPDRSGVPETIRLVEPAPGAVLDLARDPPFVFAPGRPRRWWRIVFQVGGATIPLTLDRSHLADRGGALEWRLSRQSLFKVEPLPAGFLAKLRGETLRWWVEGTDEIGRLGATDGRSEVRELRVK
jgi:hypothetical protein